MSKYRHRKDETHVPIVAAFEAHGWTVQNCTQLDKFCDVILLSPQRRVFLGEIKTGKAKLKPHQVTLADTWPIVTFRSVDEAERFIRLEEQS